MLQIRPLLPLLSYSLTSFSPGHRGHLVFRTIKSLSPPSHAHPELLITSPCSEGKPGAHAAWKSRALNLQALTRISAWGPSKQRQMGCESD